MANLPEITYRYPTLANGEITSLRPSIYMDWSTDMDTSQFSASAMLAKNIVLMEDSTSTILTTEYVSYTAGSRRLEIRPIADLSRAKTYRVLVKSKLQSTDGRKSYNEYSWTFLTASGSISDVRLFAPGDATVQPSFPTLSWNTITSLGSAGSSLTVTYRLEIDDRWDFGSVTYTTDTTASSITPAGVFTDSTTYYWRVLPFTVEATGSWSEVRSFYYGRSLEADPRSRQFLPDSDTFGVKKLGFKNGLSNQKNYPNISINFTAVPASDFASYIEVTSKSVLPRNDDLDTYDTATVSGTWALSGSTITFTPNNAIATNTRYEILLREDMKDTFGYELGEEYIYYWTGRYSPYYVSSRSLRARFLGAEQQVPDDLINFYIYEASLEANARYWGYQDTIPVGDSLDEATVRDSGNLTSYGVLKWVEAAAAYKLLKAILFEHLRDIGRTERLGDSLVSLTADFVKGIDKALAQVKEELDQWENYLAPSDNPLTVPKSYGWSPVYWDSDLSIRDSESKRDDWGLE